MAKRPSLSDLTNKKGAAAAAPAAVATVQRDGRAGAQPDGRKGILVRVRPEGWRQVRDLAADLTISTGQQVTMQSLILEAINSLLQNNGRSPVA